MESDEGVTVMGTEMSVLTPVCSSLLLTQSYLSLLLNLVEGVRGDESIPEITSFSEQLVELVGR